MQRFIAYLIWAGFLALLYWGMIELAVDRLSGRLPEAASLLEEVHLFLQVTSLISTTSPA